MRQFTNRPRRGRGGALITLFLTLLLLVDTLPLASGAAAYRAPSGPVASPAPVALASDATNSANLTGPPASNGPVYDYGPPDALTQPGDSNSAVPASGKPQAPSGPVTITGSSFSPTTASPGSSLTFTYTMQINPVPQTVILHSTIRGPDGIWIANTVNDRTVNLNQSGATRTSRFVVPLTATLGLYDTGWAVYSSGYTTLYSSVVLTGSLTLPGATPTSTVTGTATATATASATGTPTGTATGTATNTSTPSPPPANTATGTATGTPTNTATPSPPPANTATSTSVPASTATPTTPQLLSVDVAPRVAAPSSSLVLSYTLFSPSAQQVSLGAGLRVNGGTSGWFYDPANDLTLAVPAGTSTVTRYFTLPSQTNVTYDVIWGLWSAGFVTQYGSMQQLAAVQVTGSPATATSTSTSTATLSPTVTPTPTQPALVAVDVAPRIAPPSSSLVLSYTVFSPSAQQVSLGAGLRVNGGTSGWFYDPANDTTVSIPAGTSTVTRLFTLPSTTNVTYDVVWGLWSAGFVTQYGSVQQLAVVQVTGSPATVTSTATATITSTPTNTSTPTITPTPTQPALVSVAVAPTIAPP
ncbi:MAG TPA: hypothetical protein VF960_07730, partial [Chloroflexota bacterium]